MWPDPRTDGELLVATCHDPEAFAIFHRRHVRGVLAFFRRRVGAPEVALDLTAEAFATALEGSARYELRPEPARGWLYGIAWSVLNDALAQGQAADRSRRALGMEPIELTDCGVARIEKLAGEPALALIGSRGAALRERPLDRGAALTDDPLGLLERQLVDAARRQSEPPPRRRLRIRPWPHPPGDPSAA
jgi:DNA-directed RNA polymerase specialized sigma24 family protein